MSGPPTASALHRSNAIHRPRGTGRHTEEIVVSEEGVFRHADTVSSVDSTITDGVRGTQGVPETEDADDEAPDSDQGLTGLLYHIAESHAKRKAFEHRGINCSECGERPIRGDRWHCLNCPNFDLCSTCEASTEHIKTHLFVKIRIPLPVLSQPTKEHPIWYPGDPRKLHGPLSPALKKRLTQEMEYDDEEYINAQYEQFICIANVPWQSDPNCIYAAMDRRAFNKALTSEGWPQRFQPNAIYDRMFAFYDTNNDGLIGFEEFVCGIAYLRSRNRYKPLRRALQGFDMDGDGYVDRNDFLRLMRAKFAIHKLIVNAMVEAQETEQTQAAMDKIRSSQPISSAFNYEDLPDGETRVPGGKLMDDNGDMQPLPGVKMILDDHDMWPDLFSDRPNDRAIESWHPYSMLQNDLRGLEDIFGGNRCIDKQQPGTSPSGGSSSVIHAAVIETNTHGVNSQGDSVLDQQVLWQIAESGFHEMLDPLFRDREQQDLDAVNTREYRARWRAEINQAMKNKEVLQEALSAAAKVDPLMATAMSATRESKQTWQRRSNMRADMVSQRVPTDHASLERREAQIAEATLDDLLDGAGYSINSVKHDDETEKPPTDQDVSFTMSRDLSSDPTMPQNRVESKESKDKALPPDRQQLERLGVYDAYERECKARGGPGRLSFQEIEEAVRADTDGDLKGLVTSWLEWASF